MIVRCPSCANTLRVDRQALARRSLAVFAELGAIPVAGMAWEEEGTTLLEREQSTDLAPKS
jgi:hypothetical protein